MSSGVDEQVRQGHPAGPAPGDGGSPSTGRTPGDGRWCTAAVALAAALVLALTALGALWAVQGRGYAEGSAEVGFARDMYVHHDQAVVMSLLVRERGTDPEVAQLARDVVTGQAEQQGVMLGWLREQGVPSTTTEVSMGWMGAAADAGSGTAAGGHGAHDMGAPTPAAPSGVAQGAHEAMGMATDEELGELGRLSGPPADLLYVQLMQRHHRGALEMAEAFEALSDEPQLSWLAGGVLTTQERELRILAGMEERLAPGVAPRG